MLRFKRKKRNKFNARKTTCLQGHSHPSLLEANFCDTLAFEVKAGVVKSYETQVKFSMDVKGKHICNHFVDFIVHYSNGTTHAIETKGFATATWRLKKKLFEALYPHIHYEVVK